MKGWQLNEFNAPLQLVELPDPIPGSGQIVVDPVITGICHTDIGYHNGTLSRALGLMPIILGHEIAGVVSAIGDGVTKFAIGDRVAIRSGSDAPVRACMAALQRRFSLLHRSSPRFPMAWSSRMPPSPPMLV